ncbi:hypothetical protein E2986_13980 [Frieseomelitta varia]|uniref:Uncharacterized protein n=1 Tax=Frieseomelitta varia TaxID=561572 RepID=A0A833VIM4_9HYME|nr:hypothetical protein E2986_13980 [Frieseomelitta varia]
MVQTIICSVNYKSLQIVRKTSFEKSELNTVKIEASRLKMNLDSISVFNRVIEQMIDYIKEAQQYEREIFCKHIARCSMFYGSSMACMYLTAAAFSFGPAILPVSFPCEAEYPFRVNYTPMNVVIYIHQSILSFQCAAHMCVSILGASLLWYTAARFECLAIELKKSTNVRMLSVCIEKQLHLRR